MTTSPNAKALRSVVVLALVTTAVTGVPILILGLFAGAITGPDFFFCTFIALAIAGAIVIRRVHAPLALFALTGLAALHVAIGAPLYPVWFGVLVVLYAAGRFSRWPGRLAALALTLVNAALVGV